jgi:hypothetical protein
VTALPKRVSPFLHPILFAVFPLLSLFEHNETEIELAVLWLPLGLCVAAGVGLAGLFTLIFKRSTKGGAVAALIIGFFFYYGIFAAKADAWGLTGRWFLPLWIVLFLIGVVALVRIRGDLHNLTLVLVVSAAVLVATPTAKIAVFQANHSSLSGSDPRVWPTQLEPPVRSGGARLPDVYVLIPDDYARTDVLKKYFRYDDSAFVGELRKRGFVLADGARSPYSDSEMNIAAEVNMDYLSRLPSIVGKKSQDVRPVRRLIEDNRASRLLKPLGYRYIHLDSDQVTFAAGNPDISPVATPDSFMTLWLQHSILRRVGGRLGFDNAATNERFRKTIRAAFARLEAVPKQPGPKFVVFHTLLPHDPYIFGRNGERLTFPDTSDSGHSTKLGMRYYLEQLRFTQTKLLEAVDAIRARSKQPPVILILSDEGFEASEKDWGEATVRDIRVKGIAAFSLPGKHVRPPRALNTVNALRFVFNRSFATHYPLLRSASYPELDFPYQFEEMRVRGVAK